jgi:aminopeptidase N
MRFLSTLFFLSLSCLLWANGSGDETPKVSDDESNINMKFYHVDVEFDLENPFIKGQVYMEFVAIKADVKNISVDIGEGLKVTKVEGATKFEQLEDEIQIELEGRPLKKEDRSKITIHYEGSPKTVEVDVDGEKVTKGLVYQDRGEGKFKNRLIVTACYPQLGYKWFPCRKGLGDKVDSMYIDVTIAQKKGLAVIEDKEREIPYTAVSNGVLAGVSKAGENKDKLKFKWRHRHRIAPHHAVVAISNFAKLDNEYKGKGYAYPIEFYILPENIQEAQATIRRSTEIMACLTRTFGPYPFKDERFAVIEVGMPLGLDGMPTQTAVLVEDLKSFHMYQVVHQAAAMWFGNHISPEEWQDAWITEALATYAEAMWQEYKRGLNVFQIILDEKEYFEGGKLYLDNIKDYSKERLSQRGVYVIHMLRGIMGETYFYETLKGITGLKRHRSTYLSTKKFQEICEYYASENIPQDYSYFFDQWVRGEFYPVYEIDYTVDKGQVMVKVRQKEYETQPATFKMPMKVVVEYEDGSVDKDIVIDIEAKAEQEISFEVDRSKNVKKVQFDPSNWIFKDLRFVRKIESTKAPFENLKIELSDERRKVNISFDSPKKQNIVVELIKVADGTKLLEDEVVATQDLGKIKGSKELNFKIPVPVKSRGVFRLRITGKSEVITKEIRVKQVVKRFE